MLFSSTDKEERGCVLQAANATACTEVGRYLSPELFLKRHAPKIHSSTTLAKSYQWTPLLAVQAERIRYFSALGKRSVNSSNWDSHHFMAHQHKLPF